ncbi:urea carboxylase-associated family protein [Microbulbifer bruguierae]|uniref:Urea carboxylase-associated family protein n=1 Tax=Microbulbifer bruguierae TaxID=3029061 RepID=A0ABY8NFR3_9GAMM|nr:urea amidolyase associated protein UAAP1 [Microbulbifer bruguierae]WGL17775.1 urea carboxylase-associated family protein [Microbulbifer bruguierae]
MNEYQYSTEIPGGGHWSFRMRRGTQLRLTDLHGGGNAGMLFYNPENLLERYNAPDTLKCQHTFRLSRGNCLYSDMGRIFASIIEDDHGWHDTVCGNTRYSHIAEKWGARDYQHHRNGWFQNGHDAFLVEMEKYGLNRQDLAANVNWFSKVATDKEGNLYLDDTTARAGDRVVLRFEMDTLVILHSCPHPLSQADSYPALPIQVELGLAAPIASDDVCRNWCEENQRGFQNNALYHLGT